MSQFELVAEKRGTMTTGQLNTERNGGNIPGIIYGAGGNFSFFLNSKELRGALTTATQNTIYSLNLKDEKDTQNKQAMIKDMQYHPISYKLLHLDFIEVIKGKKLHIKVPVKFAGEEICKKKDGILNHLIDEIHVECLPKDIPNEIIVDLSNLNVGESIHVKDIKFNDGVKVLINLDDTVIALTPKDTKEVEAVAEPAEGAEPAEKDEKDEKAKDKK